MTSRMSLPRHGMPTFEFYRDVYGGTAVPHEFEHVWKLARWCVSSLCLHDCAAEDFADGPDADAWCRAVCAAAEQLAMNRGRFPDEREAPASVARVAASVKGAVHAAFDELEGTPLEPRF